ncbi:hypothetical protein F4561_001697 [Lipingzhangella halophila]|uniref:DUF6895 domain-containing protein n=1 Tax=Lipingzhangella halophila TaxID=1783352 RepID=A0A7W7RF75_9ACTN|nr:hypothetical protein [Lipingzhangella halophila]MBB4930877.1 hypothetical protein [Lipingzhangella halophila]
MGSLPTGGARPAAGTRPPSQLRGSAHGFPAWEPVCEQVSPGNGGGHGNTDRTRALDLCLAWLADHVHWFSAGWDDHFPPREVPETTLVELLLLCRILHQGPRARETGALVGAVADTAESMANRPDFADRLCDGGPGLGYRIWLLALLRGLGRQVPEPFAIARQVLAARTGDLRGADWSAPHAVELCYILDLAGLPHALPSADRLYEECDPAGVNPLSCSDNEVYAFTHVLLYATGFGEWSLSALDRDRSRLREAVATLLGAHLGTGHLDLVAELLMCAGIVGGVPSELDTLGWRRLAAAQHPSGAVNGPPFRASTHAQRTGERARAYLFRCCYHTTLVTAMALADRERQP